MDPDRDQLAKLPVLFLLVCTMSNTGTNSHKRIYLLFIWYGQGIILLNSHKWCTCHVKLISIEKCSTGNFLSFDTHGYCLKIFWIGCKSLVIKQTLWLVLETKIE